MLAEQRYKILFIQYVKEHLILTFYTTSSGGGVAEDDGGVVALETVGGTVFLFCVAAVLAAPEFFDQSFAVVGCTPQDLPAGIDERFFVRNGDRRAGGACRTTV